MTATNQDATAASKPLRVFISYSHKDDDLREKFITALVQLQRDGLIDRWDDREIASGTEWAGKIDEQLDTADIVILLVSPDFLASPYCYDIEMTRALDRQQRGEARVIPIILRPCDWKTSRFAKLNALPRDGKPVVDWPTADHAFLNVAQALRLVARNPLENADATPRKPSLSARARARPVRKLLALAIAGLVLLGAIAWFWYWERQRNDQLKAFLVQGNDLLNVGRYEDARQPFQQALRLSSSNAQAKLGLKISDLVARRSDAVAFQQNLREMLKQWPNDSHLRVLNGDSLLAQRHRREAAVEYKKATELNPRLAEAYFRLGVIYDKEGKIPRSLELYNKAVELSPYSAQYRENLAGAYFKDGAYDKAVAEYGRIDRFPLAALESAKIYRLSNQLNDAREMELTAIRWLSDKSVASLPENQLPWYFTHEAEGVTIASPNEKLCYAHFELSATLYLAGHTNPADENVQKALQACGSRSSHVKTAVHWELQRVAGERAELKTRAEGYYQKFLSQ